MAAEQMKKGGGEARDHLVPLSTQAFEIVKELYDMRKESDLLWVFPGARANPYMDPEAMNKALQKLGFKGKQTGHGFRGIASTMLREMGYPRDVVEKQLAHKIEDDTERVYNKAVYIEQRKIMMQAWADFIDEARKTGKLPPYRDFMRLPVMQT
jgi:integrase